MKIVDNRGISSKADNAKKEMQHSISEKVSLSKRVDDKPPEKGIKRSVVKQDGVKSDLSKDSTPPRLQARKPISKKTLQAADRGKLSPKKYTVLSNNGTAPKAELKKSKPRSLQKSVSKSSRHINLRKLRLAKKPPHKTFKFHNGKAEGHKAEIAAGVAGAVGSLAAKPVGELKDRALRADNENGNTGVEGLKLGLRGVDKTVGEARKLKKTVKRTKDGVRKIQKLVKRTGKSAKRTLKTGRNTAKAAKRSIKAAARTAKNAGRIAKATVRAAKVGIKIAVKVAKAAAQLIKQIVSFIIETAPWSLIVIAVIIVLILIFMLVSSLISSIQGSVTGAGAWAFDDSTATPEQAYENFKVYIDGSDKCIDNRVQNPLKGIVDSFCESDIEKPRLIIQYIENNSRNVTFFPAYGNNSVIDNYIDEFDDAFDTKFYSKFLAALFVLMTRDKQKAEGVSDIEIFDFAFKTSDFEEFIGKVNGIEDEENSCKYGETYIYKETEILHNQACPGEDCELKYYTEDEPGEPCASTKDEETGETIYYCEGHPYCPKNHDKLIVRLYTIEEFHKSDIETIYHFTENEKIRYEATQAFMQGLIDSYGGDTP